jgi:hypothetical protein
LFIFLALLSSLSSDEDEHAVASGSREPALREDAGKGKGEGTGDDDDDKREGDGNAFASSKLPPITDPPHFGLKPASSLSSPRPSSTRWSPHLAQEHDQRL